MITTTHLINSLFCWFVQHRPLHLRCTPGDIRENSSISALLLRANKLTWSGLSRSLMYQRIYRPGKKSSNLSQHILYRLPTMEKPMEAWDSPVEKPSLLASATYSLPVPIRRKLQQQLNGHIFMKRLASMNYSLKHWLMSQRG